MSSSELTNALNPYASQSRQRAANVTTSPTQQNYTVNSLQQTYNQQQLQLSQHTHLLQHDQYPQISIYGQTQHFDQYQQNPQHLNHVNLQQQQLRPQQPIPVASVNTIRPQQHAVNQQLPLGQLQAAHQISSIPIHQSQHTPSAPAPPTHSLWPDSNAIMQYLQEQERNMKGLERRLQEVEERREAEKRDNSKQMSEIQQLLKKNLEKFEQREGDYDKFKGQQIENDKKRDETMQAFMQDIREKVKVLESANASTAAEVKTVVANANAQSQAQARSMQYLQQSRQSLSHSPSMASLGPPQYPLTLLPAHNVNPTWQTPATPQISSTHSPSPFHAVPHSHPMTHASPGASSFNAGSPISAPSPYPNSTNYSPSPYPTFNTFASQLSSAASPTEAQSPPASVMSPPAASASASPSNIKGNKRKREIFSDGEDESEEEEVKPRRMNNHDKRVCTISKAMKVHIYEMMGIVESERLPPPPEEEGPASYADENAPVRFFWDKTVLKSAHNGRMRDRVVQSLQQNKDRYPLLSEKLFNNTNSLKQTFDQTFSTLKSKYKLQNNQGLQEKAVTKTRGSRHAARRDEKLKRRADARVRLRVFDHKVFDSAMELGCMSTEESEEEVDPETGEKVQILRTHPPAWRSKRLAKFYKKLDADEATHQGSSRKKGTGRKPRRPGAPKEAPGMLPPNGVCSWMVSRKWVGKQRATREGFEAQLSGVVGEPVGGVPSDLPGLGELGNASLSESEEEEEEEEEEEGGGTSLGAGQSGQVQQRTHAQSQLQSPHQQVPGPGQNQGQVQMALDIHGMGGFMGMQGSYVSGPSQNVQVAGANTLLPNTQTTGLYNFPPPTYYNPAPGGYF